MYDLYGTSVFFSDALFWESGDNLDLKRTANSCKRVAFAAGIQGSHSLAEHLKQPKDRTFDSNNHSV